MLAALYTVFSMSISAIALLSTVFVLAVHHHSPDKPVPHWIRATVLRHFAFIVCMTSRDGKNKATHKVKPVQTVSKPMAVVSLDQELKNTGTKIPDDLVDFLEILKKEHNEKQAGERNSEDWQRVASVLDRLFLLVYGIGIVIATSYLMGYLVSKEMNDY